MATIFEHRLDHILRTVRARTGNQDFALDRGVPQRDLVQFANDAKNRIYNLILGTHCSLFEKQVILNVTQSNAYVTLPTDDIFLDHNVISALYSHNGSPLNYSPLELRTVRQEVSVPGYPNSYFCMGDSLILSPIPSTNTGTIKLTYQRTNPDLDIRRALVASGSVATYVLTDNATLLDETEYDLANGWVDGVSFVDATGTILATGALTVVSYNSTTNTLVLSGTPAVSIVGSYMTFGKNATTHANLPPICERYITEYTTFRTQMRDSNRESIDTSPLLMAIEQEIINAVEDLEEDISAIPVSDYTMINYADNL